MDERIFPAKPQSAISHASTTCEPSRGRPGSGAPRAGAPRAFPVALLTAFLSASACVTTGTFDKKVADLQQVTADHDRAAAEREKALKAQIADLEKKNADLDAKLKSTEAEREGLRKSLDDTTALAGELKKRLEKLGQNVDKLTSEKGELSRTLEDAKGRLEELRKQKLAAEARAATFRKLMEKLRSMIDAGQLKVVIRDGRMLIALESDVLFDSGRTNLKPAGQAALAKLAPVLAGITDRKYQVAGHTDDVPIHTAKFPSNWELSTARAVEVVNFLIANGMKPQQLSAAGFGEFDPVAPNDTPERRSQNRRIEIVLQPNLSDLPSLDNLQAPSK
jgi:chemotaxis protein MotB